MTEPTDPDLGPALDPDPDLDQRLRRGFRDLGRAAGPPPPLPPRPDHELPALHRTAPRALVAAAVIAAVALVGGAVLLATDGDGKDQVRAGEGTTTSAADRRPKGTPDPGYSRLLLCPPALLDVSRLPVQPRLVENPGLDGTTLSSGPYELTWEQDGQTVRLQYPGMFYDVPVVGSRGQSRFIDLDRGGTLVMFTDGPTLAQVDDRDPNRDGEADDNAPCSGYDLLVEGQNKEGNAAERATARAVAEAVRIRRPPGELTVPSVIDRSRAEAQDALARSGLIPDWPWSYVAGEQALVTGQTALATDGSTGYGTVVRLTTDSTGFPVPGTPIACPMGRLDVDDVLTDARTEEPGALVTWTGKPYPYGWNTQIAWPNNTGGAAITEEPDPSFDKQHAHRVTVHGRPALMHDQDPGGPSLVYDTGLPGLCRFLEVRVFGEGLTFQQRTDRVLALANERITILPPPTSEPPDVTGLPLRAAADRLARAGFAPTWGEEREINDDVPLLLELPLTPVTGQELTEPGVVELAT